MCARRAGHWRSRRIALGLLVIALAIGSGRAAETAPAMRQDVLFRSGEASYFCFRIPALVATAKGTILAFAEARKTDCSDSDQIDLVLKRTEDGGKTWSPVRVLFHDGSHSMNQPSPILDRTTGVVWLVYCRDNQRVFATNSSDEGITWSEPREVTSETKDKTWKYVASGPGHGIQLSNGRLLVAAWGDTSPGPVTWPPKWGEIEFTFTMFSDDHGATWQRGRPMYENATEEAMLTETADGRVYIALRSLHGKKRGHAWSEDNGYSWSRIQFDETLPDPPAHASIIRLPGAGPDGKARTLFVNPASSTDRSHLTVRLSADDCQTWPMSRVLYEGSSAYSDLAIANNGTIFCLFEADRYSKLMLARFDFAWLSPADSEGKRGGSQ
jgi:sialidase-1